MDLTESQDFHTVHGDEWNEVKKQVWKGKTEVLESAVFVAISVYMWAFQSFCNASSMEQNISAQIFFWTELLTRWAK
jgi:hypothetical protein